MTVNTFQQPVYGSDAGTAYPTNIDKAINVVAKIAGQFAPHEAATPNMTVVVDGGMVMTSAGALISVAQQTTSAISAPTTNPRIDRVVINSDTGIYEYINGTEGVSPNVPPIPRNRNPVCRIAINTNTTAITNSIITDERVAPNPVTTVSHPNWIRPGLVGSTGLAIATVGTPTLAALNATDVAFIDDSNDSLRTYRFDGSTWAQIGSSLAISVNLAAGLAALNGTDVALYESIAGLRTYRFDGSTWAQIGSSLAISANNVTLAALNGTDVACFDGGTVALRTYRFNGSTWAQIGSSLGLGGGTSGVVLTALNATDVAIVDGAADNLRVFRFDGSTWAQIGSSLTLIIGTSSICALNGTDVALIDSTAGTLGVYRFDSRIWVKIGSSLSIGAMGVPALAALNGTDVAFIDSTNDSLRTYRFAFYFGNDPYHP